MNTRKKPLIIAHRGNGNDYPENTIEACDTAIESGAQALEIDVRYCASGELVVIHDSNLKRLMGVKKALWTTPLKELKSYSFLNAPSHIRVPTLEEFLEHFRNRTVINLDLKTWWPLVGQFSRDVVRVIKRAGDLDQLWISSFNPLIVKTIKLNTERIKTGYLFQRWPALHLNLDRFWQCNAWHPHRSLADASLLKRAEEKNKEVYLWTVNTEEEMKKALSTNHIDGIITDNSALLASLTG